MKNQEIDNNNISKIYLTTVSIWNQLEWKIKFLYEKGGCSNKFQKQNKGMYYNINKLSQFLFNLPTNPKLAKVEVE